MATNFHRFGPAHLIILGAVPAVAVALALVQRRLIPGCRLLRIGFGIFLLADAAAWYSYLAVIGQPIFPGQLPLELCDFSFYLIAIVLLTLNRPTFDIAYYWSLAGSTMALLTPNIWEHFPSLSTVQFFVMHGLVVSAVLYLVWSGQIEPRRGSVFRAMVAANLLAAFDGAFNAIYQTNYMYLRAKPGNSSLLNFMGPWPWYILAAEPVAIALFLLLYWPFWRKEKAQCGRGRRG